MISSTFLGGDSGPGGSRGDQGTSITLDNNNNVCITGLTDSTDFPTTRNAFDTHYNGDVMTAIFISKLDTNLTELLHSTLYEGSDNDQPSHIFVDSENNIYVTGVTYSTDIPMTNNSFDSLFGEGTEG